MDANAIDDILEGYFKIAKACEDAIRADHSLIAEEYRWLPSPWASDFTHLEMSMNGTYVYGSASVWTNQTGGSNESCEFYIPLDTLNKHLKD